MRRRARSPSRSASIRTRPRRNGRRGKNVNDSGKRRPSPQVSRPRRSCSTRSQGWAQSLRSGELSRPGGRAAGPRSANKMAKPVMVAILPQEDGARLATAHQSDGTAAVLLPDALVALWQSTIHHVQSRTTTISETCVAKVPTVGGHALTMTLRRGREGGTTNESNREAHSLPTSCQCVAGELEALRKCAFNLTATAQLPRYARRVYEATPRRSLHVLSHSLWISIDADLYVVLQTQTNG